MGDRLSRQLQPLGKPQRLIRVQAQGAGQLLGFLDQSRLASRFLLCGNISPNGGGELGDRPDRSIGGRLQLPQRQFSNITLAGQGGELGPQHLDLISGQSERSHQRQRFIARLTQCLGQLQGRSAKRILLFQILGCIGLLLHSGRQLSHGVGT